MDKSTTTVVVKETLDPTSEQVVILQRYADASRCSFNFALGIKHYRQKFWARGRDLLVDQGQTPAEAAKNAPKFDGPTQFAMQKIFLTHRDKPLPGPLLPGQVPRRLYPWWKEVNAVVCHQAFRDADAAFNNWKSTGRRNGAPVGYPRFKRRGRCRDSFRMFAVRLVEQDLRHVRIGGGGGQPAFTVRLHRPARRLARLLARGGVSKSVTIAREGHRWVVAFNVRMPTGPAPRPSRRQRAAGTVGVDLGVKVFVATSDPVIVNGHKVQLFENPRHLENTRRQLHKRQRRMARRHVRGVKSHEQSKGWKEARDQVARLHALVAARRATSQHLVTKRLVTQYAQVALENLRVKNMTASARGTAEMPGRNVRAKAGLNRAILDVGFGEIRRQIEYKALLYGVTVSAVAPAYTSQTCNRCGHVDAKSRRTRDLFTCTRCGHATHADIGAAINIKTRSQPSADTRKGPNTASGNVSPADHPG
ncbi:RNA-guided endonuclease InsQ/TnpB family protein [Streptomyces sp. NPDC092952]|uniref:RNA-guided endonuclease InsQ/TnpB family protein n=1 Tax=Streptomyces sp. NPDC092952 TaxID=3366018 RepID=UPI0037FBA12A